MCRRLCVARKCLDECHVKRRAKKEAVVERRFRAVTYCVTSLSARYSDDADRKMNEGENKKVQRRD